MSCGQPYKHNTSVYRSRAHDKIEHCEHIVIGGRDSIPTDGQHLGVALLLTPQANRLICAKIDIYEGKVEVVVNLQFTPDRKFYTGTACGACDKFEVCISVSSRRILPHSGNMVVLSHVTYMCDCTRHMCMWIVEW